MRLRLILRIYDVNPGQDQPLGALATHSVESPKASQTSGSTSALSGGQWASSPRTGRLQSPSRIYIRLLKYVFPMETDVLRTFDCAIVSQSYGQLVFGLNIALGIQWVKTSWSI